MRIQRIELEGFGRLEDFSQQLAAGMHVFFGPNEAGKSTLQRAILALLYGFYETDRARPAESAAREYDEPWNGTPYRGRLEYELADGRRFRIHRDFSTTDVPTQVHDLTAGGRDVTDEYTRGRHGNLDLARKHLGMPKAVFEACAFVSQGELFEIQNKAKEIGKTVISLADSAERDRSALDAVDRLDKIIREDIGTDQARIKKLPAARSRLAQLKRELEQIDAARGEIAEEGAARDEAQTRAEELRNELRRKRYLLSVAQAEEARHMLAQLDGLTQCEEEARTRMRQHEAHARFPEEERPSIQDEWTRIEQMEDRITQEREAVQGQRERIETLALQREGVAREWRDLAHLRDFPIDRRTRVDRLAGDWRAARQVLGRARTSLDAIADAEDGLTEYETLEAQVGSLTEADVRRLRERLSESEPSGLLAAIGRFFSMILLLIRRLFGGKRVLSEERGALAAVSREEADRLLAQRERWNELRPRMERYRSTRTALEAADASLRQAEHALRDALRGTADDLSDLGRTYELFLERCEGAARLQQIETNLAAIDRETETLATVVQRFEQDERQVQAHRAALATRLRELAGRDASLRELLAAFDEGCQRRRMHDDAQRDLQQAQQHRGILLGGRSPDELRRTMDKCEQESRRILADAPSLRGATTYEQLHELSQSVDRIEEDLHTTELRIRGLTARIDTELGRLRARAEVEEEVESTRRESEKLERFRDELQIAMQLINEAAEEAHRDFGPHVGRLLSAHMAEVTGGRYRDVYVDPAPLDLRVQAPETRRLEEIDKLSRGTQAAAYLLLRIGLAQHMSSMHEPVPLILDDPLVDLDDVRLDEFLDLLLRLSQDVQILLFTKDGAVRQWFERHCGDSPPHRLTPLPDAAAAPAPRGEQLLSNGSEER